MFEITEDALTNAIFNNSTLDASGSGTKADARAQARNMLTGLTRVYEYLQECAADLAGDHSQYVDGERRQAFADGKMAAIVNTMRQVRRMIESENNSGQVQP